MEMKDRIRELRKRGGYTQKGLADALGVSFSSVSSWELGTRRPSFDALDNMCDLFKVKLGYLVNGEDEPAKAAVEIKELDTKDELDERTEYTAYLSSLLQRFSADFVRLDEYGRNAILALCKEEMYRCEQQKHLEENGAFVCKVEVKPAIRQTISFDISRKLV